MPWGVVSLMSLRQEFVELSETRAVSFTELCRRYGISERPATSGSADTASKAAKDWQISRAVPREVL